MNNNFNNNQYGQRPPMPGYPQQPSSGYPPNQNYPETSQSIYPTLPGSSYPNNQPYQSGQPQSYPNQPYNPAQPQQYPNQPYNPAQPQTYPNQPYNPGQQAGFGGYPSAPQNPSYYPSGPNNYPNQNMHGYPQQTWDERSYLKRLFDDIDTNRNGEISEMELREALKRGHSMHEFDPHTVRFLLEKFDRNRDNLITFQEFYDLYTGLNIQYNEFLDMDRDSSGFIDGRELFNALNRRGYTFTPEIFDYIVYEISRRSGKQGVYFDTYVRVIARFDYLRDEYNRQPYKNMPLEKYIRDRFF